MTTLNEPNSLLPDNFDLPRRAEKTGEVEHSTMASGMTADRLTEILRDTIVGTVRRDGPDLSARQFAVMLICYIENGPHTVRGLAARLNISKPAVTRSLDRLEELGLARRIVDPADRRSVLVQRTREGTGHMTAVRNLLVDAAKRAGEPPASPTSRARGGKATRGRASAAMH